MPGRDIVGTPLLAKRPAVGSSLRARRGRPVEACTDSRAPHLQNSAGDRCRQRYRLAAWACLALISTGFTATQTTASEMAPCLTHTDCRAGDFCGYSTADSYEGWTYRASVCKPCSTCECHIDSATAICPVDRCPFAKLLGHTSSAKTQKNSTGRKEQE